MTAPTYFEEICERERLEWEFLTANERRAGVWHQMFLQVQDPRHVVSELLQNADDAGAKRVHIRVDDGVFVFEHDGEDFTEEQFSSLCSFGFSNKRSLHTIGFRGVGFKSIFSLGEPVEIHTPTISVGFRRERFTEPFWATPERLTTDGRTRVCVPIADERRMIELEASLGEWMANPVSLLFFRNIRSLAIGDQLVQWDRLGPGPAPNSDWVGLAGTPGSRHLLVTSGSEPFPTEALTEIRQERLLPLGDDFELPPGQVTLVLGAKGRLFSVLPTEVETKLPFACNAPFLQDPARVRIKSPERSVTNRWLLERLGGLAAETMVHWLGNEHELEKSRARAYELLPQRAGDDSSLASRCAAVLTAAFEEAISGEPVLLAGDGLLVDSDAGVFVPRQLEDIWTDPMGHELLDARKRAGLSKEISDAGRANLIAWGLADGLTREGIVETLRTTRLPTPRWSELLRLWAYLSGSYGITQLRIVPIQGDDRLFSPDEVVRLGERNLLRSDEDWAFLSPHLKVMNPNWPRFLTDRRRSATEPEDGPEMQLLDQADTTLRRSGLGEASDVATVVAQVAQAMFAEGDLTVEDYVRIAQIAAKLDVPTRRAFQFVTKDSSKRAETSTPPLLYDVDGGLAELLPGETAESCLLHEAYSVFKSCTKEEWEAWIVKGRSRIRLFPPPVSRTRSVWGRDAARQVAASLGAANELEFRYVTDDFRVDDWRFDTALWTHWEHLAQSDEGVWARVLERLLAVYRSSWLEDFRARLEQIATTGSTHPVTREALLPGWVAQLQKVPCLLDTWQKPRLPAGLLRRTAATEPLLEIEPFVHRDYDDVEANLPLLDALGVRSAPAGPTSIVERIQALTETTDPPIADLEILYRKLDRLLGHSSTEDVDQVRQLFRDERLILAEAGTWTTSTNVFLMADETDVPGAPLVRASVRDLTLWRRIGVAERPTVDLAVEWLRGLPSGDRLRDEDVARVRALLARHPHRIWSESGHWLNLNAEWVPTTGLQYMLSSQSDEPWGHLHVGVKRKTADCRKLPAEVTDLVPFSELEILSHQLVERLSEGVQVLGVPHPSEWMRAFGTELRRIVLDNHDEMNRVRLEATRLAQSLVSRVHGLESVPYLDGAPVGTPRRAEVLWIGRDLYVEELPAAKLARRVPEEIGKVFNRPDVKAALDYSYERRAPDIVAYLRENFTLEAEAEEPVPSAGFEPATAAVRGADDPGVAASANTERDSGSFAWQDPTDNSRRDDEAPGEEELELEPGESDPERPWRPPRAHRGPGLAERWALAKGFLKVTEHEFRRLDGQTIRYRREESLPWEWTDADGSILSRYWARELCLERESLELPYEVWQAMTNEPYSTALLLVDSDGNPIEISGYEMSEMVAAGKVALYPASYRLVHQ